VTANLESGPSTQIPPYPGKQVMSNQTSENVPTQLAEAKAMSFAGELFTSKQVENYMFLLRFSNLGEEAKNKSVHEICLT
jgi:hypothetical protein